MNIDEEETVGLLYQHETSKSRSNNDKLLRNRPTNPGAWKYAAAWIFFTFFSVFVSVLVVRIVTNNIVGNETSAVESTSHPKPTTITVPPVEDVSSSKKPNFIFILADDIGYGILDSDNFPFAPNIGKFASEGIIFENYYTQELCSPSRAALLTGRYPSHLGLQFGELMPTAQGGLTLDATLLPSILKTEGNYKSYAFGKWNLGHSSPDYLPTSRGFDYYLGYLTTENMYWSKSMSEYSGIRDFMESTGSGYWPYKGEDSKMYSTQLYASHAQKAIRTHDFVQQPMFMYLAFQAAHPPFEDILEEHKTGLTSDDIPKTLWDSVRKYTAGHHRQQYIYSIALLDSAIKDIWSSVIEVGQEDNTYLVFASDNGGCPQDGGSNNKFRGSKGTLFEGGTHVDAFLYHSSLKSRSLARSYNGLVHVSDWFPSILSLAGINAIPGRVKSLDGFDHSSSWMSLTSPQTGPRESILYNYYYNVESVVLDKNVNASVAIRDHHYKLVHTFVDNGFDGWHDVRTDALEANDDVAVFGPICTQTAAMSSGTFSFLLFDLVNDPYERTNLYDNSAYAAVKTKLLGLLQTYEATIVKQPYLPYDTTAAVEYWTANGQCAQPWIVPNKSARSGA